MSDLVPGGHEAAEIRLSDAERQRVMDRLRTHCVDGMLTLDEFGERVGRALEVRTRAELDELTRDLPGAEAPASTRPRMQPTPMLVAFMGGAQRKGRWRASGKLTAIAVMGGCEVDLRSAEIEGAEIEITAFAFWGGVEIIVPEGIPVELDGFAFMGGKDLRVSDAPILPGAPVVRVHAFALMGGVSVRTKRARRGQHHREEREHRGHCFARPPHVPHIPQPQIPAPFPRQRGPKLIDEPAVRRLPADLHGTVTLLFTDIESFTTMSERLGDVAAQEVLRQHHALLRAEVSSCGGHVVKTQGDGAMIAFQGASQALHCAVQLQRALTEWNLRHPDEAVRVRMGLHTGEAVREGDDFGGRAVIMAARIASEACGGEILVSGLLHDLTAPSGRFTFGECREVELKGLAGTHRVLPVIW